MDESRHICFRKLDTPFRGVFKWHDWQKRELAEFRNSWGKEHVVRSQGGPGLEFSQEEGRWVARRPPFTGLIAKLLRSGQGAMTETGPTHPRSIRTCYPQKATYIDTVVNWSDCEVIERDPNKVSGAWVFIGTRVPVSALFDNLDSGATVNEFLDWFPGVTREQVDAVLSFASKSLATA